MKDKLTIIDFFQKGARYGTETLMWTWARGFMYFALNGTHSRRKTFSIICPGILYIDSCTKEST